MPCENRVGVKNILLTFIDCDTEEVFGPISHELATEDLPTWRLCGYTNEAMPAGFVSRVLANPGVEISVIRDLRIPLEMYQGCSDVTLQVEYWNGLVYSAVNGAGVGDERSDGHEVTMDISFKEIDELLPAGQLQAA
jgi:hypothetical protein